MSAPTPAQRRAADPSRSVWVTANAGTGKTRLLSDRVLRLLLTGAAPDSLLCITFTKAAAGEMRLRVEEKLAAWAVGQDAAALARELEVLTGAAPDAALLHRARQLFARVLDLPQDLPVMTIHALCGALLRRFPIEAGIAPHFEVIDDRTAQELLTEARERVLREAQDIGRELATAIERLAVVVAESTFGEVLAEALAARTRLLAARERHRGLPGLLAAIALTLDLDDPAAEPQTLLARACVDGVYDARALLAAANVLRTGSDKDSARAATIATWLNAAETDRVRLFQEFCGAFLKADGDGLASLATRKCAEALPALLAEQARLVQLQARLRALVIYRRTEALLRVAFAVIDIYEAEKARTAALDYDDLIERTRALVGAPGKVDWVRYKLDARIDHVLVDEAQDTSPAQWEVIERLTDEFFAGAGAGPSRRTLFVVGDEKQSIYSFQGADLATFRAVRDRLTVRARDAGLDLGSEVLDRSFRSVPAVLALVDRLFAMPEVADGVVEPGQTLHHDTDRAHEIGLVELWPLAAPAQGEASAESWPLPDRPRSADDPDRRLASAIARKIARWLRDGERLEALDRPLRAGDILILLSRRGELQELLVRALKQAGVPVAGADRLELGSHIAVMDLVALGRAILLPEDDLNLACLLKSPLLELDEEALFALAHERGASSLMERLRAFAKDGREPFATAYARLAGWIAKADFKPPFELYAEVLGPDRGRKRLLGRLGPDAAEPIEAFLAQTLAYEEGHPATLEGFLHWLGLSSQELKRDPEPSRDAVRVITMHGAKGLEAPVVILADAGPRQRSRHGRLLWSEEGLPFWRAAKARRTPATEAMAEAEERRETEERRRLLYVALTRARDRLHIVGKLPASGKDEGSWHALVRAALETVEGVQSLPSDLGRGFDGPILRLRRGTFVRPDAATGAPAASGPDPLPAWATSPVPPEEAADRARAPSRLGEDEPPASSPAGPDAEARFRFGRHVHKLLQILPELPPEARSVALQGYLARAADLEPALREHARSRVEAVLQRPDLVAAFGPGSRAEQAICGVIDGVAIAGQIDRLAVTAESVLIVDYKTNRRPHSSGRVPVAYLRQMAAYRELLRRIYPDRPVEAALVWTETATVDRLESAVLDAHIPTRMAGEPDSRGP